MKKTLMLLLVVLIIFGAAACSPAATTSATSEEMPASEEETSAPMITNEKGEQFTIGYTAATLTGEFNKRVSNQLQALCDAEGVKLVTLSAENDVNAQTQQVENFITMGVDAMVIFPVDPAVMGEQMQKARDAGIFVVDADQLAAVGTFDTGISVDMKDLGVTCVQLASDWIDKTFPDAEPGTVKVAVFGVWATEQFAARCDVMTDIASYNDKAIVVEKYELGLDYSTTIPQYIDVLLQQHPDINAILSFTDTFALTIDEIMLQKGLDISKFGQFTVDLSAAGIAAIQNSKTDSSTVRGTAAPNLQISQELFDACLERLDPNLINADGVYFGRIDAISADNVDEFVNALE